MELLLKACRKILIMQYIKGKNLFEDTFLKLIQSLPQIIEDCLKDDGVIYEFALKNKTSGANDVLCLSEEDAKKHILKQNLLMEFRNKRFYENDCNLDQLLLMKAGYHYDPTGPMAEHWQKILEYEKGNY